MRLKQLRLGQRCFSGFFVNLAPRPKFYEHGSNTAGLLPCNKGSTRLIFVFGVFLVACRSELPILYPLKGGNACQFFLAACRPQFSDFKPLKEGEMLDNFVLGVFLVTCRSEWAILKPLKGGNSCQIFVGCLPTAILRF
jgi:hypothetical protein